MINDFWDYLQKLADISTVVINRPKDSTHQRYPNGMYPVNYGYLKGTTSIDSGGVDIWVGFSGKKGGRGALYCGFSKKGHRIKNTF